MRKAPDQLVGGFLLEQAFRSSCNGWARPPRKTGKDSLAVKNAGCENRACDYERASYSKKQTHRCRHALQATPATAMPQRLAPRPRGRTLQRKCEMQRSSRSSGDQQDTANRSLAARRMQIAEIGATGKCERHQMAFGRENPIYVHVSRE